jgi:hypothetical protein
VIDFLFMSDVIGGVIGLLDDAHRLETPRIEQFRGIDEAILALSERVVGVKLPTGRLLFYVDLMNYGRSAVHCSSPFGPT